jgi:hypothetical protein
MATYFPRGCPRCTRMFMVQVVTPVNNGMIRAISGYARAAGHRFEWTIIRGKAYSMTAKYLLHVVSYRRFAATVRNGYSRFIRIQSIQLT